MNQIDLSTLRKNFPALAQKINGNSRIFLDGAGGTQVPQGVIDAMVNYMVNDNGNYGGYFDTSIATDRMLVDVRKSVADFINAPSWEEILIGPNMTTLTFSLVWTLARDIKPGDEVVVTRMDHGANIDSWRSLKDYGAVIKFIEINDSDCTLNYELAAKVITPKTKIVAVGLASNATGTINDIRKLADLAHKAGALIFVDAVHYAPHFPIDVAALDADFLACSAYKFFGPHVGFIWGRMEHLKRIDPHRPWAEYDEVPSKFVLGTPNMEGLSGAIAAIDYLAGIGREFGKKFEADYGHFSGRRLELKKGLSAIAEYEKKLGERLNAGLKKIKGLTVYGITDENKFAWRCPTFSFFLEGYTSEELCRKMNKEHIYVWNGVEGFGALELMKHFDLVKRGGLLRVSIEHYNTVAEIDRFLQILGKIAAEK
jgi:cysteine desulfurase family protein (TIGR01976 family)